MLEQLWEGKNSHITWGSLRLAPIMHKAFLGVAPVETRRASCRRFPLPAALLLQAALQRQQLPSVLSSR